MLYRALTDETGAIRQTFGSSLVADLEAATAGPWPEGWVVREAPALLPARRWQWDDGWVEIEPPLTPDPVPASLTRVQFLLVADSVLIDPEADPPETRTVEEIIEALITGDASLTDVERRGLLIRFRGAQLFPRDWPHLEMLAPGLTPTQLDDLYRYGATL